jgi:hypothetical protein
MRSHVDKSLTAQELVGLKAHRLNLTDAHPRYQPLVGQQAIFDNVSGILKAEEVDLVPLSRNYWDSDGGMWILMLVDKQLARNSL